MIPPTPEGLVLRETSRKIFPCSLTATWKLLVPGRNSIAPPAFWGLQGLLWLAAPGRAPRLPQTALHKRWSRRSVPVQAPSAPQGPARFPGPCIKRCPGGCNCPGEQAGLERPQRQWYKQSTKAQTQSFPLKIQTQVMLNNVKQLIRQRLPEAALRPTSSMPYTGSKTSSFTGKRCRATALTKAPGRDPPVWCPVLPTEQERNAREGVNCLMLLNAAVTRRPTQETIKRPTQSPHHTQSPPTPHHTTHPPSQNKPPWSSWQWPLPQQRQPPRQRNPPTCPHRTLALPKEHWARLPHTATAHGGSQGFPRRRGGRYLAAITLRGTGALPHCKLRGAAPAAAVPGSGRAEPRTGPAPLLPPPSSAS